MKSIHKCIAFIIIALCITQAFAQDSNSDVKSYVKLVGNDAHKLSSFSYDLIEVNPVDQTRRVFTNFNLPESCIVSIKILDTMLTIRYEYEKKKCAPGRYEVQWNFKDSQNNSMLLGPYYFDLEAQSVLSGRMNKYSCRQRFWIFPLEH